MAQERIGILGLGRMGSAMAARLAGKGHAVRGWSRSSASVGAASRLGIERAADLGALVAASDILILALLDDTAVVAVLGALAEHDLSGRLVVDTSTVSPQTLRSQAAALGAAGADLLDAPISGGPDMLLAGTAGLYIGGDPTAFERFRPVADLLSNRIHHVGPLGQGAAAKLVNNMMLMGLWQNLKEALLLGTKAGLPAEKILDILSSSPAASLALKSRLPVIRGETEEVGFPVSGAVKDARLVSAVAAELGIEVPAMSASLASFESVLAAGLGGRDLATMVRHAAGLMHEAPIVQEPGVGNAHGQAGDTDR